jgi:hypothetical protein
MFRKVTYSLIMLTFILVSVHSAVSKTPNRILFIGNSITSWNNGLDYHMEGLTNSEPHSMSVEVDRQIKLHSSLRMLWSIDKVQEAIKNGNYDVVVLQEDIPEIDEKDVDVFYEYARKFITLIRESGSEPVLLMAYAYDRVQGAPKREYGWITMDEIAQAHSEIAVELDVAVAPFGLAMRNAMEVRPELDMIHKDKIHPSSHGTYLAVAVLYATIFEKSPVGLSYIFKAWGGVTEEEAAFLQRIAWETVQEYQAQH